TPFMPNWRSSTNIDQRGSDAAVVSFPIDIAKWDKDDDSYALEMEQGGEGHYDFPFENVTDQPAEIGLRSVECDCTSVLACVVPAEAWRRYREAIDQNPLAAKANDWHWEKLNISESKGYEVPPRAKGFIRLSWHGRKAAGSRLSLGCEVWDQ